jgi:integrase
MASKYATKKRGKTEKDPFWNLQDIKNLVEWFENNNKWDGYLITMFELLLGRRIGDTVSMLWSDFYYENGKRREEMMTVVEQKTGKTNEVPLTNLVFEAIEKYCQNTNINPMEHYNEYIFNFKCKTEWIQRKDNPVYKHKECDVELFVRELGKTYEDDRKAKIVEKFHNQKEYTSFGDYFYYEVEYTDIIKFTTDTYRKMFNKAKEACGIEYDVSTHSFRKSFGYWIHHTHPYDPDCLLSLQKMFGHATLQQTMDYFGLTKEKNRMYINDHSEMIRKTLEGDTSEIIKNSPVISLKTEDFGDIIMKVIKETELSDVERYQMAINMANDLRIGK